VADATRLLRLWWVLVRSRLRSQMAYPAAFAFDLTASALMPFLDFVIVLVLFSHLPRLAGFSLPEVGVLYGLAGIALALADLVFGQMERVGRMVRDGSLDQLLVRPVSPLVQVVASDISLRRIGRLLQGGAVLVWSLAAAHVEWDMAHTAALLASVVSGAVIFAAIFVIEGAFVMVVVDGGEALNALTYGGGSASGYPLGIYAAWLRDTLTYVSYYPALYLLGLPGSGEPAVLRFLAPVAAVALAAVAAVCWRISLRHYSSTGS
jgi:ABC-2 type transport system permease protein